MAYSQGYSDGKEKGYFELEHWLPNEHSQGCGCRPCLVVGSMIRKLGFEEWLAKKGYDAGEVMER